MCDDDDDSGVPAGMELTETDVQPQLTRRRPGQSKLTTPRDEKDLVTILSGTERGKTLGTPVCLMVKNLNIRPMDYAEMATIPRPGHADYTYQAKYGIRASSGGGRASARETIGRVAAGAIAEKWLDLSFGIEIVAWVSSIGDVQMSNDAMTKPWTRKDVDSVGTLRIMKEPEVWRKCMVQAQIEECEKATIEARADALYEEYFVSTKNEHGKREVYHDIENQCYTSDGERTRVPLDETTFQRWQSADLIPVRCPDVPSACKMSTLVRQVKNEKDSIGGTVTCVIRNVPVGWGEPCFDKLEAMLGHAMLSLPATKAFEIGSGFEGTKLRGSVHNDCFVKGEKEGKLATETNFAGGTLGGISSGQDITFRVAIKPVSTIGVLQKTCDFQGKPCDLEAKGRHDACVLPRAVPLVEAMSALVLADVAMLQKARQWEPLEK